MRIPVYLAVAQWALLFTLGILVIVMYRQLGRHFSKSKPSSELGPPVGGRAVDFEYARVTDGTVQRFTPGGGQAALVAFVGPTCPACEELVMAIDEADHAGDLAGVRPLLLISDPPSYLQISEPFRTTQLEIGQVLANATLEAYRASATPLLVAIDCAGIVRSAGPVARIEDVRTFAHACLLPSPDRSMLPVTSAAKQESQHMSELPNTFTDETEIRLP
jgi:hypothetical protein